MPDVYMHAIMRKNTAPQSIIIYVNGKTDVAQFNACNEKDWGDVILFLLEEHGCESIKDLKFLIYFRIYFKNALAMIMDFDINDFDCKDLYTIVAENGNHSNNKLIGVAERMFPGSIKGQTLSARERIYWMMKINGVDNPMGLDDTIIALNNSYQTEDDLSTTPTKYSKTPTAIRIASPPRNQAKVNETTYLNALSKNTSPSRPAAGKAGESSFAPFVAAGKRGEGAVKKGEGNAWNGRNSDPDVDDAVHYTDNDSYTESASNGNQYHHVMSPTEAYGHPAERQFAGYHPPPQPMYYPDAHGFMDPRGSPLYYPGNNGYGNFPPQTHPPMYPGRPFHSSSEEVPITAANYYIDPPRGQTVPPPTPPPVPKVLSTGQFVNMIHSNYAIMFLDTETTGLGADDVVIQFAITDMRGNSFSTYINPGKVPIKKDAYAVHSISDRKVADAPSANIAFDKITDVISAWSACSHNGKQPLLVAYNAAFDARLIHQTLMKNIATGVDISPWLSGSYMYADLMQVDNHGNGIKLANVYSSLCESRIPDDIHSAAGDARILKKIYNAMYNRHYFSLSFPRRANGQTNGQTNGHGRSLY
jgi:hypothetical protein